MMEEYFFLPLDIFRKSMENKEKKEIGNELEESNRKVKEQASELEKSNRKVQEQASALEEMHRKIRELEEIIRSK